MPKITYESYERSDSADEQIKDRAVLLIDNALAQELLSMEACLTALQAAYGEEVEGSATSSSKTCLHVPTLDPAAWHQYVSVQGGSRQRAVVAIRIRSNIHWHTSAYGKTRLDYYSGVPNKYAGLILLFSSTDGALLSILNDGHIQHMRVGATSGLATSRMARPEADTLGILGSGGMATTHAWAVAALRRLRKILVFSPNPEHRERFANQLGRDLEIETIALADAQAVVQGADIVCGCTNSCEPVIQGAWLKPGTHVSVCNEYELDDQALSKISRYAVYRSPSTEHHFTTPEAWRPASLGGITDETLRKEQKLVGKERTVSLSEVVVGNVPGRASNDEITCVATGGAGVQFAALADEVYNRARERGLGNPLPLGWFLQDIRS